MWMRRAAPDYSQKEMTTHNIHVITTLIPTRQVRQVGGMDERVDAWEDWAFHLRLAQAGICGYRTDQPVFVYRVHEGDRMKRFYTDRSEMDKVWALYRNEQGVIPMTACCGGDATLAQVAGMAIEGAPAPPAVSVGNNMVRVKYVGEDKNSTPFDFGHGDPIRLGANAMHRYANVSVEQAAWLAARIPIIVVPEADPAVAPPPPLPVVAKPNEPVQALRPQRATA